MSNSKVNKFGKQNKNDPAIVCVAHHAHVAAVAFTVCSRTNCAVARKRKQQPPSSARCHELSFSVLFNPFRCDLINYRQRQMRDTKSAETLRIFLEKYWRGLPSIAWGPSATRHLACCSLSLKRQCYLSAEVKYCAIVENESMPVWGESSSPLRESTDSRWSLLAEAPLLCSHLFIHRYEKRIGLKTTKKIIQRARRQWRRAPPRHDTSRAARLASKGNVISMQSLWTVFQFGSIYSGENILTHE